jgi:tetratricopeptide (TPR) repeat protein
LLFRERHRFKGRTYKTSYNGKGCVLYKLQQYQDVLEAYEQALQFSSDYCWALLGKGNTLYQLQRYSEAIVFYEKALQHGPFDVGAYALAGKGDALFNQKMYLEAIIAYDRALELEPDYAYAHYGKGNAHQLLGHSKESEEAFEKARYFGYNF